MIAGLTVKNTMRFSLLVQIVTGLLALHGLFIILPEKDRILTDILGLETLVQFIEMIFYVWISYATVNVNIMASRRYIDWFITTPAMLLSTIAFMKYEEEKEKNESITFLDFLKENKNNILLIFSYNLGMLLFGYLGEVNIISKYISIPIGFLFFYKSFELIYYDYAIKTQIGKNLFTYMGTVWSLYGIAAMAPANIKNTSYNLLDIVAKNFYGLYLYYKILQTK
jgi:bacteriorhodopsin